MRNRKIICILALFAPFFFSGSAKAECEYYHWIASVHDTGKIIKLEDGSVWKVSLGDDFTNMNQKK